MPEALRYALRAWYGRRNLPSDVARLLATRDLGNNGGGRQVDPTRLRSLLQELNRPEDVGDAEVDMVMREADILGDGRIGRAELMRAISAWYTHVARKESSYLTLIRAAGLWMLERGYHREVLTQLNVVAPSVTRALMRHCMPLARGAPGRAVCCARPFC